MESAKFKGLHGRKGMALLVTVLLTSLSAGLAIAATHRTSLNTRTTGARLELDAAWDKADKALVSFEAGLAASPDAFLRRVLPNERDRICRQGPDQGRTFTAGDIWPSACGSIWGYTEPSGGNETKLEIAPPGAYDSTLSVRVLSRVGQSDAGFDADYVLNGAGRWTWASTGPLDISTAEPSETVSYRGGIYGVGQAEGPAGPNVEIIAGDSAIAADGPLSFLPGESPAGVGLYSTATNLSSTPAVRDVRGVAPTTLTSGQLAAAVAHYERAACPGLDETGATPAARTYDLADGRQLSHVCITSDATLQTVSGEVVNVPSDLGSVMVVFNDPAPAADGDEFLSIYTSPTAPDLSGNSALTCTDAGSVACTLPGLLNGLTANEDPSRIQYWTNPVLGSSFLGDFALPASGVMLADADLYVGYCSSQIDLDLSDYHEYGSGEQCLTLSGRDSGQTITQNLTFVAGTTAAPADIVVNSPIVSANGGTAALVGTSEVRVPYWTRPFGSRLRIDAHLLGAGIGLFGQTSVSSFPSDQSFPQRPDVYDADTLQAQNWAAEVAVSGSVTGADLLPGIPGAMLTTYRFNEGLGSAQPAWFAGAELSWERISSRRIAAADECAADNLRSCLTWVDEPAPNVQTIATTVPSPLGQPPSAPSGVTAEIIDEQTREAAIAFDPATSSGDQPITYYQVTAFVEDVSTGRTCVVNAEPLVCFMTGFDSSDRFSFKAQAFSAAGASPFSAPSNEIQFIPDPPTDVNVVVGLNGVGESGAASVTWTSQGTSASVQVLSADAGRLFYSADDVAASSQAEIDGLPAGDYEVLVSACSSAGCSVPTAGTFSISAGPYAALSATSNDPIVWWPLSDTVGAPGYPTTYTDLSGNGFDAAVTGDLSSTESIGADSSSLGFALSQDLGGTLTSTASGAYESFIQALNPWGWWAFDNDAGWGDDSSGNGRNGSVAGTLESADGAGSGPLTGSSAIYTASSRDLPAPWGLTTDLVRVGQLPSTASSWTTVSCWVYMDGPESGACVHVGEGDSGFGLGVGSATSNYDAPGRQVIGLFPGVRWIKDPAAAELNDGWNHLAMKVNSATGLALVYVNGEIRFSSPGAAPLTPVDAVTIAGQSDSEMPLGVSRVLTAALDDVAVFESSLSDADIALLADTRRSVHVDTSAIGGDVDISAAAITDLGSGPAFTFDQRLSLPAAGRTDDGVITRPDVADISSVTGNGVYTSVELARRVDSAIDYQLSFSEVSSSGLRSVVTLDGAEQLTNTTALINTRPMTMAGWVRVDGSQSGLMMGLQTSGGSYPLAVGVSDGGSFASPGRTLTLRVETPAVCWASTGVDLPDGWNHVSVSVATTGGIQIFANGERVYDSNSCEPDPGAAFGRPVVGSTVPSLEPGNLTLSNVAFWVGVDQPSPADQIAQYVVGRYGFTDAPADAPVVDPVVGGFANPSGVNELDGTFNSDWGLIRADGDIVGHVPSGARFIDRFATCGTTVSYTFAGASRSYIGGGDATAALDILTCP